jgi:hypothetical protein
MCAFCQEKTVWNGVKRFALSLALSICQEKGIKNKSDAFTQVEAQPVLLSSVSQ